MESGSPNHLVDAGRLLEAGDLDGAVRACQRALRLTPDSFPAHLKLAETYWKKHSYSGDPVIKRLADREFGEAMRCAPADQNAHNALFDAAVSGGATRVLREKYRGEWASLPFAEAAARRLKDVEPVVAPARDPSSDRLRAILKIAVLLVVAGIAWQAVPAVWRRLQGGVASVSGAPSFTLDDLSGRKVTLADFRGKAVVIVDFWATWCPPCRASLPALHELRKRWKGKGVEVLNVSLDDDTSVVQPYLTQEGLDLWVLLDRGHAVARAWGVTGIPCIFVIDKNGIKRDMFVGYSSDLDAKLEELVNRLR